MGWGGGVQGILSIGNAWTEGVIQILFQFHPKSIFIMILVIQVKIQAVELRGVPYRHSPLHCIVCTVYIIT